MAFLNNLTAFTSQWLNIALPKLFLLFLGILVCIGIVAAIWDKRIKSFGACFGLSFGFLFAAIALEEGVVAFLGGFDSTIRIRILASIVSIVLLLMTFIAVVKTRLHLRYALLWSSISLLVFLTALFPGALRSFPSLLGIQYGSSVTVLVLLFLLLLAFHVSIVISDLKCQHVSLTNRVKILEQKVLGMEESETLDVPRESRNFYEALIVKLANINLITTLPRIEFTHGTSLTAPAIILLAVLAVTFTGMLTPQVMIGDEVTHFYMMQTQSEDLSTPNFQSDIPTGWGGIERRRYPHSFFWHYIGALLFVVTGGSFFIIQLYQACFLAQLLGFAYLLARERRGVETRSALVYLLLIASIPMTLIFSVAFYQDIPMTAQIVTAFYFLRKDRWVLATLFLCLALGFKVTAILFFPSFFLCLVFWKFHRDGLLRSVAVTMCSLLLVSLFTWGVGKAIKVYAHGTFYPIEQVEKIVKQVERKFHKPVKKTEELKKTIGQQQKAVVVSEPAAKIIANHPGDLRVKSNFVIYGGVLIWLTLAGSCFVVVGRMVFRSKHPLFFDSSLWLWGTGLSYIILVAWFLRTSPDARFFLPGVLFCLLPVAERIVSLPKSRWVVILITAIALMQSGYALAKTYNLRQVNAEIYGAIRYLQEYRPEPSRIFMYPEGNYRLFPVPHKWYLKYRLRDFWRANNDTRIEMLHDHGIGAIVIKKHLIRHVDKQITDLGVYPTTFVEDLSRDERFARLYENSKVIIYRVPQVNLE